MARVRECLLATISSHQSRSDITFQTCFAMTSFQFFVWLHHGFVHCSDYKVIVMTQALFHRRLFPDVLRRSFQEVCTPS